MTLVAFKAGNHPQQIGKGGGDPSKDERFTRIDEFLPLHAQWHFTVDAAGHPLAPVSQAIGRWWTKEDDGLAQCWDGERVWCNPPYSNIGAWVEKAWESLAVVAMLLPSTRTEQPWWQRMIEPYRDREGSVLRAEFRRGRGVFGTPENPHGSRGLWKSSAPFGLVLLTWTREER